METFTPSFLKTKRPSQVTFAVPAPDVTADMGNVAAGDVLCDVDKKPAAKKTPAKKTPAKKTPAKKTPAKSTKKAQGSVEPAAVKKLSAKEKAAAKLRAKHAMLGPPKEDEVQPQRAPPKTPARAKKNDTASAPPIGTRSSKRIQRKKAA